MNHEGKIAATPTGNDCDKNIEFIVKLPEEQAIFSRPLMPCRREHTANQPVKSGHSKRVSSLSQEENQSTFTQPQHYGSIVRRTFVPRVVKHCDSRGSVTQSSTESQYSRSDMSYSFTDSMEIAGFTSDSSLESFQGI